MAQLDCGVENCVYNKSKSWCKGDIMVGGKHAESKDDTCCESFSGKRAGAEAEREGNMKKDLQIYDMWYNKDTWFGNVR